MKLTKIVKKVVNFKSTSKTTKSPIRKPKRVRGVARVRKVTDISALKQSQKAFKNDFSKVNTKGRVSIFNELNEAVDYGDEEAMFLANKIKKRIVEIVLNYEYSPEDVFNEFRKSPMLKNFASNGLIHKLKLDVKKVSKRKNRESLKLMNKVIQKEVQELFWICVDNDYQNLTARYIPETKILFESDV